MNSLKTKLFFLLLLATIDRSYSQTFTIHDTFDDDRYNWWIGDTNEGSEHIHDGKMYVNIPEGGWVLTINPYVEFEKDFKAEVSIRQIEGFENNGVGILWGYSKKDSDQNYFIVSADGSATYMYRHKTKTAVGVRQLILDQL